MNRVRLTLIALTLLGVAGAAQAQFSSTITAASEYDFRGFAQTGKDPALQGSLDYSFSNGLAVGAWASNVDFGGDADIEVDYYATFSRDIREGLAWTAGITDYTYPGSDDTDDYLEYSLGLDTTNWSFKTWYSPDFYNLDLGSAFYSEGNGSYELPSGFSLLLHVGYSWGDYWDDDDVGGGALVDFMVGVGYTLGNFDLAVKLTGTDASGDQKIRSDLNNNEPRVLFTVSTTLPWGGDEE